MYSYRDYDAIFSGLFGGLAVFLMILILLIIALAVVYIVATWKMFKKAGKGGWESIVPFYSSWVLVEIAGLNWWWFLLFILGIILKVEFDNFYLSFNIFGFLANFICYYNIARKFGKDKTTAVFAGIFSFIFVLIFGLSKNEVYDASIPVSKNGIFGNPETEFNSTNNYDHPVTPSTTSVDGKNDSSVVDERTVDHSFCGNCGTKLSKDMLFCPNCGKENK